LRITDASRVDRELARLRGTGIEGQAQAEGELQEEQQRVSDAMLRHKDEQILAQSNSCMCPISHALMRDPVVAADGHTYKRIEIQEWIRLKEDSVKSPMTNASLEHTMLPPNHALKANIDEAVENTMPKLRASCAQASRSPWIPKAFTTHPPIPHQH
jgi:hypothetical protein